MQVVIVRHAKAEDAGTGPDGPRRPDAERALTSSGRQYARLAGRVLDRLCPGVDALAVSPLRRAAETGALIARQYKRLEPVPLPALAPAGSARGVLKWLHEFPEDATVVLVGHEPDLSRLAGWLMTGAAESVIELKKGAICLIEFRAAPAAGHGSLRWLLAPAQVRALRR
jgi:phosphohistidine phosphatase